MCWQLGFFHPMLEGLGLSQGLLWLHQPIVLAAKPHVLQWEELIPVQDQWHRVIILDFGGTASCLSYLERHPHPSDKFSDVALAGNLLELLHQVDISTCCACQQIHSWCLSGEDSGIMVSGGSSSDPSPASGTSSVQNSWTQGLRAGRHLRNSSSILGSSLSPQVSGWGTLAPVSSLESSSKVTHLLNCPELGDWAYLLDDPPWCVSAWGLCLDNFQHGPFASDSLSTCSSLNASDHS